MEKSKKPISKSQDFVFTPTVKISETSTNDGLFLKFHYHLEFDIEDDDSSSLP